VTLAGVATPAAILAELTAVFERADGEQLGALARAVEGAERVFFAGQGRSGLIAAVVAVRIGHLGWPVHVAGEATCPAIGPGDVLIAFSKTGTTEITLHQARRAAAAGASIAAVTARPESPLATLAGVAVVLPVTESAQHAGTLFEQSALVLGDALCAHLQASRGLDGAQLAARHDNLQRAASCSSACRPPARAFTRSSPRGWTRSAWMSRSKASTSRSTRRPPSTTSSWPGSPRTSRCSAR
jgi:6-phospho-3-hexuloisomerase